LEDDLSKMFVTFGLLCGKQLVQEMSSIYVDLNMVSEGTVKSNYNIDIAALF